MRKLLLGVSLAMVATGCTKAIKEDLADQRVDLNGEIDRSDTTDGDLTAVAARVEALEARVTTLQANLTEAGDDLDSANARIDLLTARVADLESHDVDLDSEILDLQTHDDDLDQSVADLLAADTGFDSSISDLASAITLVSPEMSVFDNDDTYVGPLVDLRMGSITFLDTGGTGLLVEAFLDDPGIFGLYTENVSSLVYTTTNCTGTSYLDEQSTYYKFGVLDQNTGRIYEPTVAGWSLVTIKSAKGMWPGAVCQPMTQYTADQLEMSVARTLPGAMPLYFGYTELTP